MPDRSLSIFLAGDAVIVRPWSGVTEPAFLDLVARMRAADVTIANLETVIHEYQDYAQAESGGSWMASPPLIATELKWAGIDMLSHANNHGFDYGAGGVLETHRHLAAAGLIIAGSGADLQAARAPRFLVRDGGSVALVAATANFGSQAKASAARSDMRGRPGVNPLKLRAGLDVGMPPHWHRGWRTLDRRLGGRAARLASRLLHASIVEAPRLNAERGVRPERNDLESNLGSIRAARTKADIVVCSIHAHKQMGWLPKFAHQAIEAGADIVFAHGPHQIEGVEIYRGRPVFYGLGDFVFEPHCIERFPSELYAKLGLPADATADDARAAVSRAELLMKRGTFEACAATMRFGAGKLAELRLLPLELGFDLGPAERGRPQLAAPAAGQRIVGQIAALSARYGTSIRYDAGLNEGVVSL